MTSFSESLFRPCFDWNAFLNKEVITKGEWMEIIILSRSWVTCACGTQCDKLPRYPSGEPRDILLSKLGCAFHATIKDCYYYCKSVSAEFSSFADISILGNRYQQARLSVVSVLADIEKRSAFLLGHHPKQEFSS